MRITKTVFKIDQDLKKVWVFDRQILKKKSPDTVHFILRVFIY